MKMVVRKTWEEFRASGLLWWINRILHTFGWAIVIACEDDGKIEDCFPARVKFRGFDDKYEKEGFIKVSNYLQKNISEIKKESLE